MHRRRGNCPTECPESCLLYKFSLDRSCKAFVHGGNRESAHSLFSRRSAVPAVISCYNGGTLLSASAEIVSGNLGGPAQAVDFRGSQRNCRNCPGRGRCIG